MKSWFKKKKDKFFHGGKGGKPTFKHFDKGNQC